MTVDYSGYEDGVELEKATSVELLAEHGWKEDIEGILPAGGRYEDAVLAETYSVSHIGLDAFFERELFLKPEIRRWRRFIRIPCYVLAELEFDAKFVPIGFHVGPAAAGLSAAMEVANELKGDYRGQVVLSPGIKFAALHLSGDKELFIPFPPNLSGLENYEPIDVEEASKTLRPLAKEVAERFEREDTSGG